MLREHDRGRMGIFSSLNEDVLDSIVSRLRFRDALRLSETCQSLHRVSTDNAISDVYLTHPGQLDRFCAYMLADAQKRLPRLRRLEIIAQALGIPDPDAGWSSTVVRSEHLVDVLKGASNLQYLDIECIQSLLNAIPCLSSVLRTAAFRSESAGHVEDFLPRGSTHLHTLILTGCGCEYDFALPLRRIALGYLSSFSQLTRFECSTPDALDFEHPVTLSSVTRLAIGWGSDASLIHIVSTFPNVRSLYITLVSWRYRGTLRLGDTLTAGQNTGFKCWKHLDELRGTTTNLAGHIRCPVRALHLLTSTTVENFRNESDSVKHSAVPIVATSPLWLSLSTFTEPSTQLWRWLGSNAPRLRFLDVRLSDAGIGSSMDSWIEDVPPALHSSRLVCMRLRITDTCHAMPGFLDMDMPDIEEEDIMNALPIRLAKSIPSLRYFGVGVGDKSYDVYARSWRFVGKTSWWRVLRSERDDVRIEPISADVGERIIAYIDSAEFELSLEFDDSRFKSI
ncbi:uncharacterized protein B0H18DRAFT_1121319 [Fomitopsis serialis]|uniref:uncharacterized protein n=1 Tax=Fomitopsis serialis TaxID=139415 RepID=UPI0020074F41|nr:uncharacterized protein B0H18DRAFT_1121319 [Neoantrodia serialis]KAH9921624.1 hypothetical protein B0H18DRAFT_1121319 [Neoantrodia serialis]